MKMNNKKVKRGFSIPEVIVAVSMITLVIMTATNLLVSSMRGNRNNVNRMIAYNLAQEALEGVRNIRDGNWLQNQYWRGSEEYKFFGEPFIKDGKYIIQKKHTLFTEDQCTQKFEYINNKDTVQAASPWELKSYNDEASKLYRRETNNYTEYTHQIGEDYSGFKRWVEIQTVPHEDKIGVTAVVEWEEQSQTKSIRIPMILTDWKSGSI